MTVNSHCCVCFPRFSISGPWCFPESVLMFHRAISYPICFKFSIVFCKELCEMICRLRCRGINLNFTYWILMAYKIVPCFFSGTDFSMSA